MSVTSSHHAPTSDLTKQNKLDDVIEFYDRWAAHYDQPSFVHVYEKELLLAACEPHPKQKVVEFGSGTGRITQELLARGANVTSVEPSANMRRQLTAKCQRFIDSGMLTLEAAALTTYTSPSQAFELMVLPLVIDHLANLHDLFAVAKQTLTKSGRLVISGVNPYYQLMVRKAMVCQGKQRNSEVDQTSTQDEIQAHCHFYSDLFQVSRMYGFTVQSLSEGIIDDKIIQQFPQLSDQRGYPNIYVMRFDKVAKHPE